MTRRVKRLETREAVTHSAERERKRESRLTTGAREEEQRSLS